jgi:hypothetical protein
MKRYLLYDSGCSSCGHLAETVREAVGESIDLLSLRTAEAKELLDTALPNGWRFAPYVVTVDEQGVHARTGVLASMQLGLWMGPRKAMRVWKVITQEFAPKRRGFLRGSLASVLVVLFMSRVSTTIKAFARCGECIPNTRCQHYIYSICGCGTCCSPRLAQDRFRYYRLRYNPIYPGESCTNCAYCGYNTLRIICGCRYV